MKNPVNIAKKGYNRILKIDDLSAQLDRTNASQSTLETQIHEIGQQIKNIQEQINVLKEQNATLADQNNTLRELICANVDIEKVPLAKGYTRLTQLANLKLLLIIQKICKENNLEFYLNFGSLLGAVRHHGYIPWDDDIDIMMIREDYNKIIPIFKKYFSNTKLFFVHSQIIRVYYSNTPIQVDIFPSDFYNRPVKNEDDRRKIGEKIIKIHQKYIQFDWEKLKEQKRVISNLSYQEIESIRRKVMVPDITKKEAAKTHPAICHSLEQSSVKTRRSVHDYDWVYPLKTMLFEGRKFPVPNQPSFLLNDYYGDYMNWPPKLHSIHDDIQSRANNETFRIVEGVASGDINMLAKI